MYQDVDDTRPFPPGGGASPRKHFIGSLTGCRLNGHAVNQHRPIFPQKGRPSAAPSPFFPALLLPPLLPCPVKA